METIAITDRVLGGTNMLTSLYIYDYQIFTPHKGEPYLCRNFFYLNNINTI